MRQQSATQAQLRCARFNERCPVGTRVMVRRDHDEPFATSTASLARVTASRAVLVMVDGMNGWQAIDRVVPARLETSA